MAVIIRDEFTGMSSGDDIGGRTPSPTNTPGNTWNENAANTIESDGSGAITAAASADDAWIDTGEIDCAVSIEFNAGGADNRCSVYARTNNQHVASGTFDGYETNWRIGADTVHINKVVDGGSTQLGATISQTLTDTTTYKFELEVNGTTIRALLDDGEIGSRVDSAIDGTTEGGSYGNFTHWLRTDGAARFDNFEVDDLAAAGGTAVIIGP